MPTRFEPRKTPLQSRAEATVQALLDATAAELVSGGYDRMSTNKVARRAGVSIGSLYQYFPNKESLVVALRRRLVDREREQIRAALAAHEGADLLEVADAAIRALIGVYLENPELHMVFATQVPAMSGLEPNWDGDKLVEAILRREIETRDEAAAPEDADHAAFILVHAIDGVIMRALLQRPAYLRSSTFIGKLAALAARLLDNGGKTAKRPPKR